jgi:Pentapeptide repeats (8 copies)
MANGGKPGVQHPNAVPRWLKALWDAHPLVVVAIAAVVAVAVSVALIWPITDLIAAHDVGLISGSKRAAALQTAREVVRTQLLTLGAGVFAAGALIFTALNFNLLRQGQVTDRYTKAIEQLGSKTIDVSIGGVYALERIARDSAKDHPTVMEVLTACIREHSPKQWPKLSKEPGAKLRERTTRPDIQAALTVIGRRDTTHDQQPINLSSANLTRATLAGNLTRADLTDANLTHADLGGADLTGADLTGAQLTGAYLTVTNLTGAYLTGADLTGAHLTHVDLTAADLRRAHLDGAELTHVDLTGADLTDATLSDASLSGATLTRARWPLEAQVPDGWELDITSGRLNAAHTGDVG